MTPRLMKQGDAAEYCGMSVPKFREIIQPHVKPITGILDPEGGKKNGRCIHFDREDLDRWIDNFKAQQLASEANKSDDKSGDKRPTRTGGKQWAAKSQVSSNETASGTSTKSTEVSQFAKALTLVRGPKRNGS